MKPRTVLLTLELSDCTEPLGLLRSIHGVHTLMTAGCNEAEVFVAQASASVAQPSTAKQAKRKR